MNSQRWKTAVAVVGALLLSQGPARAEMLDAYSTTAMAITGNIELTPAGMEFEDGTFFAFDGLDADQLMVDGRWQPAEIYLSYESWDPVLLNGNSLCGEGGITFVGVWSDRSDEIVTVAVFTTQDTPQSDSDMCASYNFIANR